MKLNIRLMTAVISTAVTLCLCLSGFVLDQPKNTDGLTLLASSELLGGLEPCGCSKPMNGGFLRRTGLLESIKTPSLRLDNGDITEAAGRQDEIKAETAVQYFNMLHYDAVNLGEEDFKLGLGFVKNLALQSKTPLISANVVGSDDKPLFSGFINVKKLINGAQINVLVIGLLSPSFQSDLQTVSPELKISEPRKILDTLFAANKAHADMIVLLYHGRKLEAEALAKAYPFIIAVVYAHLSDSAVDSYKVGNVWMIQPGQKGKAINRSEIVHTEKLFEIKSSKTVTLSPEIPESPNAEPIRQGYLARINAENLISFVPKSSVPGGNAFVGSKQCLSCHQEAHKVWTISDHSHAFHTLEKVGHQRDPECVGCHTVGFTSISGFVSHEKTPQLENVGCENCHGPGKSHVDSYSQMGKVGAAPCMNCHTPEQSPGFDFKTYWPKIKH